MEQLKGGNWPSAFDTPAEDIELYAFTVLLLVHTVRYLFLKLSRYDVPQPSSLYRWKFVFQNLYIPYKCWYINEADSCVPHVPHFTFQSFTLGLVIRNGGEWLLENEYTFVSYKNEPWSWELDLFPDLERWISLRIKLRTPSWRLIRTHFLARHGAF